MSIQYIIAMGFISAKSFAVGNELQINLTVPETNTVIKCLYKAPVPAEETMPIVDKIRQQILPQLQDSSTIKTK